MVWSEVRVPLESNFPHTWQSMTSLYTQESTTWERMMELPHKHLQCCMRGHAAGSWTHPAPVQLVQPAVDPLLHIQPPLQLFAVVFDGDPRLPPLEALTRGLRTAAHLVHPPAHPLSRHPGYHTSLIDVRRKKKLSSCLWIRPTSGPTPKNTPQSIYKIFSNQEFRSIEPFLSSSEITKMKKYINVTVRVCFLLKHYRNVKILIQI